MSEFFCFLTSNLIGILVLSICAIPSIWLLPKLVIYVGRISKNKEDEFRRVSTTVIGGLIILIGLSFSGSEFSKSQKHIKADRFSEAIKLLSEENTFSEIGGIHLLEQAAIEFPDYRIKTFDIIISYIKYFRYEEKLSLKDYQKTIDAKFTELARIKNQKNIYDEESDILKDFRVSKTIDIAFTAASNIRCQHIDEESPKLLSEVRNIEKTDEEITIERETKFKELYSIVKKYPINLSGISLLKLDSSNGEFSSAVFNNIKFWRASFRYCSFRYASFNSSKIWNSNFRRTNLYKATLNNANLIRTNFIHSNLMKSTFHYADFQNSNFVFSNLKNAEFIQSQFIGAYFKDSDLRNTIFYGANLYGAKILLSKLQKADLTNTDLRYAVFTGSDLEEAILKNSILKHTLFSGVNLTGASLAYADLEGVRGLTKEQLASTKCLYGVKNLSAELEKMIEELRVQKPELFEKPKDN